ncbi:MAG: sigma 54-interacting transcriptional regulator [Polyangiales bacterium]
MTLSTLTMNLDRRSGAPGESVASFLFQVIASDRPRSKPARHLLDDLDEVLLGRGLGAAERIDERTLRRLVIPVADAHVSSNHAKLERLLGRWTLIDLGSKNGTIVNAASAQRHALEDGDVVEIGRTLFVFRDSVTDTRAASASDDARQLGLDTLWPPLERATSTLAELARSRVSIVLRGETGTGKEVVARALHSLSGRRGPLVPVNCGALPPTLVESTLFGHKKGSFSGATDDQPGLVRASDGGTLFLDEIGDLPLASQTALLRVLQESEVMPVGASRPVRVDLRVVAATHHDLEAMVADGRFRSDLWARLSGHVHALPALRDRREDLGLIVAGILEQLATETPFARDVAIDLAAARAMLRYDWPRNIRELHKALSTAIVLAFAHRSPMVTLEHLPKAIANGPSRVEASCEDDEADDSSSRPLSQEEQRHRDELIALLREHHGNLAAIARVVGKGRTQVQRWLKRYALNAESYR